MLKTLCMYKKVIFLSLTAAILSACGSKSQNMEDEIMNMPVVGKYVTTPDRNEIMIVDYNKLNEELPFSLDNLLEDIRMVQLDSSTDEAIVGDASLYDMTDNYYAVRTEEQVKLFQKDGRFISNIGRRGQGPDEYKFVYDIVIDEPSNRIYLLEMGYVDYILAYDLSGRFIGRIPLPHTLHKGKMIVEGDKLMVAAMKFDLPEENYPAVWIQDLEGNIISSVDTGVTTVYPDFSNEIYLSGFSEDGLRSLHTFHYDNTTRDSLYRITDRIEILPNFTVDYGDKEYVPTHTYTEYPKYFVVTFFSNPSFENGQYTVPWSTAIIDKKTGRGSYVKPVFDKLGGLLYKDRMFGSTDYMVYNIEPGDLELLIDESIKSNSAMLPEQEKKLKGLLDQIDMDGNNIIIFGKFKNNG